MPTHITGDSLQARVTRGVGGHGNSKFFKDLEAKAIVIAGQESKNMAEQMVYILQHRQQLKGGSGQYPRYNGDNGISSKKSFMGWTTIPWGKKGKDKKQNYWAITNTKNTMYDGDEFSYPTVLVSGNFPAGFHAPYTWEYGKSKKIVKRGGKYFSSQLPRGLDPWLKIKREDLIHKIQERFDREL